MHYCVYGPFEVPRNQRLVSRESGDKQRFWDDVDAAATGLADACGCYVFIIRKRAWYIGMAEKQGFRNECFESHKIVLYNEALQARTGRPQMILIARMTPQDRFAKPSKNGRRDISLLEKLIIGMALRRNPSLQNVRGTKLLREMKVPGVLNTGRGEARAKSVQALKKSLGL